jgi:hypothetical protein
MEAAYSSETLVHIQKTTQRHIPQGSSIIYYGSFDTIKTLLLDQTELRCQFGAK